MRRRVVVRLTHLLVVLAGLALLVHASTSGSSTELTCRGVPMQPGSICLKADGSEGQTYEQRLATRRTARPVVAGMGLLISGFGTVLLVGDLRRRRSGGPGSSGGDDSPVEQAG